MERSRRIPVLLALTVLVAGCGGAPATKPKDDNPSGETAASSLMLDGQAVGADGTRAPTPRAVPAKVKARTARDATAAVDEAWPVPALLGDGSLDDGPDPFLGDRVQAQPLPIEDDATTTAAIDAWATELREVNPDQWGRWMGAGQRSPWQQDQDAAFSHLVKVTTQRCGGARAVATGVVLGNETVVTTVHAVESIERRVRISLAGDDSNRLAAIVRYLDVDDDIAVLKVPGLRATPMEFHTASGADHEWGFAYGAGHGGLAGNLRRTPAVIATQEQSLTVEQPDGFAEQISDRSVLTAIAGVDTGFSGGVITATSDPKRVTGFGFAGLVRARVSYRSHTAPIVVPPRLVRDAISAAAALDPWFEHRPTACPQWRR